MNLQDGASKAHGRLPALQARASPSLLHLHPELQVRLGLDGVRAGKYVQDLKAPEGSYLPATSHPATVSTPLSVELGPSDHLGRTAGDRVPAARVLSSANRWDRIQ